ncbi:hypothetical protein AB9K17_24030, partial [Salmonella enterica subsp. enterica serovar Kentucky]|uniref:hypothetical protein n=1 Tax=Salmonella enterica TaxID=28901 RepID=UPI003F4B350F
VIVACGSSTVLSDSVKDGVATVLELSLIVASNTKLVGMTVGNNVLSEVLGFALLIGGDKVTVGRKSKVTEGVIIRLRDSVIEMDFVMMV